jgi:hypothetical protein
MLYGEKYWLIKRRYVHQISVAEMYMLRWIYGQEIEFGMMI